MASPDTPSGRSVAPKLPGAGRRLGRTAIGAGERDARADRRWIAHHRVVVASLIVVLLLLGWTGWRAERAWSAYQGAKASIDSLEALRQTRLSSISATKLDQADVSVNQLDSQLRQLRGAITPPAGVGLIERLPWIGTRYRNGQRAIAMGIELAGAGKLALPAGNEILSAFNKSGAGKATSPSEPTWLSALWENRATMDRALAGLNAAAHMRADIDPTVLPGSIRDKLPQLDKLFQTSGGLGSLVNQDLPAIYGALGGSSEQRYLVLFQNSDEVRLSGGFPGTAALITVSRGQLASYRFYDIYDLQQAYAESDPPPVEQPYPVSHYFAPHRPLQIQDAVWGADFAEDGKLLLSMYRYTGLPSIDGVIAVTPAVVSRLIETTGPLTVEISGKPVQVTPDNVQQLIEQERNVGSDQKDIHKEVVALIGQQLLAKLRAADRSSLTGVARNLKQLANTRDIQLYSADPTVEALLDARHWSGRLQPDSKTPTISVNVASVIPNKASRTIQTQMNLDIGKPENGRQQVTLALTLHNTGKAGQEGYYFGEQIWWVAVTLPDGARLGAPSLLAMPDPDAPNGGAYAITLKQGTTQHLTISFSMPEITRLLIRRQPAVNDFAVSAQLPGCSRPDVFTLSTDTALPLNGVCH